MGVVQYGSEFSQRFRFRPSIFVPSAAKSPLVFEMPLRFPLTVAGLFPPRDINGLHAPRRLP